MALLVAYALMLVDAIMTILVHEEAGELNPLFARLLAYDELRFIYAKLAVSLSLALGLLVLNNARPAVGRLLTFLTMGVYLLVAYVHLEVYRSIQGQGPLIAPVVDSLERMLGG